MFRVSLFLHQLLLALLLLPLVSLAQIEETNDSAVAATDPAASTDSSAGSPSESPLLRVGVAGNPPFVIPSLSEASSPSGFSVELWRELAEDTEQDFKLIPYASVDEALSGLASNSLDAVVGPISITSEREQEFAFTQPYFISGLGVLSEAQSHGVWARIKPFFSRTFFIALAGFLMILGLVGALVWVSERRKGGESFGRGPVAGVGNGIWLALVTMTTVGYGDLAPRTIAGRVVLGTWMVVALLSATSLLAGLAGTIALAGGGPVAVQSVADLKGMTVAVSPDSIAHDFAREHGIKTLAVASIPDGVQAIEDGRVRALIFDRPQLRYYLARSGDDQKLILSNEEYRPQGYGFVFPADSPQLKSINLALLEYQEAGKLSELEQSWLDSSEEIE